MSNSEVKETPAAPSSPRITPTIQRLVREARADGLSVAEMLVDVQTHARRHQNRLTFDDAVELARMLRPEEDGS
jgi:hypothetical protein